MKKFITLLCCLFVFSCSKNKTENQLNSKQDTIYKGNKDENSTNSKIDENQINKKQGLNYVKIFMYEGGQYNPTAREGYIIKHDNNICTGCFFEYDVNDERIKGIYEFSYSDLIGDILDFKYRQITLDYLKTGDYTYFEAQGEIYHQYMQVKKQKVTDTTSLKQWDDIKSFREYYKIEKLPEEALKQLPELSKYLNIQTNFYNKNLPKYSDVRGTLINETNVNVLTEIMGKPDDVFNYKDFEWDVYYFAIQKNGKVGHLVFRINGLYPRKIDEITFYNPGDKIRVGLSYFVSPVSQKNN